MEKISVFIITKNEEKRVSNAIKSVLNIADEIIIVDSGSTDNTISISQKLGAQVVNNSWEGYLQQKSFAEGLCRNKWILNIDADEELSSELQHEIQYIFSNNLENRYNAYRIKITIIHRLDEVVRCGAPFNQVIRLYNKDHWGFIPDKFNNTHDAVSFKNATISKKIYNLNEPAFHRSGTSISQLVNKANFYSSEQADDLIKKNVNISCLRIIFELPYFFLKTFFFRKYYIFGFNGFIDSMILAFARFLRLVKAREENIKAENIKSNK